MTEPMKPVAWINKRGDYVEVATKSTVFGSHTIPLYTADQIKAAQLEAIEETLKAAVLYLREQYKIYPPQIFVNPDEILEKLR